MAKTNLCLAAIVIGSTLAASNAQAATTWVCNVFVGPKHYINKALRPWGRDVAKVTKGAIKVRFLPAKAAPAPKQIDGIVGGTFDCAFIFHAFTAKRAIGQMFGILPFISEGTSAQGSVAYWRVWKKYFTAKKEFEDDGIKILSMFQFPGVHIFTARDKPINSVADLKSQKVWALAGTSSRTMKSVGVNHVSGPASRMAEFTQTKVIQGIVGATRGGMVNFAGVQFPKHGTFTRRTIMMPSFAWMVSLKKWNALSPELQKAVLSVSGEKLARKAGEVGDAFEAGAKKKLAKVGMKEITASAEFEKALTDAAKPQINAWIKRVKTLGVDGKAVLADYAREVQALKAKK